MPECFETTKASRRAVSGHIWPMVSEQIAGT